MKWLMFILASFAGKVSSEESPAHVHPEAEGVSGPGCHQEGEEGPVPILRSALRMVLGSRFVPALVAKSLRRVLEGELTAERSKE